MIKIIVQIVGISVWIIAMIASLWCAMQLQKRASWCHERNGVAMLGGFHNAARAFSEVYVILRKAMWVMVGAYFALSLLLGSYIGALLS